MKTYTEILFGVEFLINTIMLIASLLKALEPWLS